MFLHAPLHLKFLATDLTLVGFVLDVYGVFVRVQPRARLERGAAQGADVGLLVDVSQHVLLEVAFHPETLVAEPTMVHLDPCVRGQVAFVLARLAELGVTVSARVGAYQAIRFGLPFQHVVRLGLSRVVAVVRKRRRQGRHGKPLWRRGRMVGRPDRCLPTGIISIDRSWRPLHPVR